MRSSASKLHMQLGNNEIQAVDGGYWDNTGIETAVALVQRA